MRFVLGIFDIALAIWNIFLSMNNFQNGSLVWAAIEITMAIVLVVCGVNVMMQ